MVETTPGLTEHYTNYYTLNTDNTCHVPRPKVVMGISSKNHFKKESSPFPAWVADELD